MNTSDVQAAGLDYTATCDNKPPYNISRNWHVDFCSPRDPSIQIVPTLGPKVSKYYLHWAIWISWVEDSSRSWVILGLAEA